MAASWPMPLISWPAASNAQSGTQIMSTRTCNEVGGASACIESISREQIEGRWKPHIKKGQNVRVEQNAVAKEPHVELSELYKKIISSRHQKCQDSNKNIHTQKKFTKIMLQITYLTPYSEVGIPCCARSMCVFLRVNHCQYTGYLEISRNKWQVHNNYSPWHKRFR